MQNIKLTVAYDGTDYFGFQIQKEKKTVQKTIQDVLSKIYKTPIKIDYSGRTDKGVHALGQVVNFFAFNKIPIQKLETVLNNELPGDIRVKESSYASFDFSSRYSAKSREYRYYISFAKNDLFKNRFAFYKSQIFDINNLNEIAKIFVQKMDFSKFSISTDKKNTFREVFECCFFYQKDFLVFKIKASGFLWKMVRNILNFILENQNKNLEEIKYMIKLGILKLKPMPAKGLFLHEVFY